MIRAYAWLVALLALLMVPMVLTNAPVQAAPGDVFVVRWEEPGLRVRWSDWPADVCVFLLPQNVLVGCGSSGDVRAVPAAELNKAVQVRRGTTVLLQVAIPLRAILIPLDLRAVWGPDYALHVRWSSPNEACLYLDQTRLERPCESDDAIYLATGGVDGAYVPRPGMTLRLVGVRTQTELARLVIPEYTQILPLVAVP